MPPQRSYAGGFEDFDIHAENEAYLNRGQQRRSTNERARQRQNEAQTARRQATPVAPESRPSSLFQDTPEHGPAGQGRLFSPQAEPEAFETKWQKRARTERVPAPRRTWNDIRPTQASPGRGVSQKSVRGLLGEQGVTTRGAKSRLRSHYQTAQDAAGGGIPRGQDFYAKEQADRFEEDAKHFGVPFHVALAVNAVMSPKTALATPSGLQTNREAAHMVLRHVMSGRPGTPNTGGRGLRANASKAADIVRQHLAHGTHPLDATDTTGHHLLSGPKVEEYYSSYIDPSRAPTDIQHSRILFGPKVRSEMSPDELAHKKVLDETYGKSSPESGRFIPKTPAEQLLSHTGVHEWASHVTGEVAQEFGVHPSEFQSVVWHEHKTRRGGRSAPQTEVRPLFTSRTPQRAQSKQPTLSASQFRIHGG